MADSVATLMARTVTWSRSAEGLGIVRDRFGFKPLMLVETDDFVAVGDRGDRAAPGFPGDYRVAEPPPASVLFFPLLADDVRIRRIRALLARSLISRLTDGRIAP